MKILWFTNTPCGATEKLISKSVSTGWLSALESKLKSQEGIEINVAFYYPQRIDEFEYNGVHYIPIYDSRFSSKWNTLLGNYKELIFGYKDHNLNKLNHIIEIVQPDIIHIHGTEQDYGLIQAEIKNIPCVISIQGVVSSSKK